MSADGQPAAGIGPIETVDYHTGGEPFRIVTSGVAEIPGSTVLERRRYARDHLDQVRRLLIDEPRGHADMYGAHVVPPNDEGADLGVIFFHNEGYSTACGHGTIALITWAIDSGRVPTVEPVTEVVLDVPSGRLACRAQVSNGQVTSVEFTNVPAYVEATDLEVRTSRGPVHLDVAFGGAFYGSLEARRLGLDVSPVSLPSLIALERELRREIDERLDPTHPDEPELRGTYGIIYWQAETAEDGAELVHRNVTVFANGEVDRSPCGSGTSARLALLDAAGELPRGGILRHRSIVDSIFHGRVTGDGPTIRGRQSVITAVSGSAYRTGTHIFGLDPRDDVGTGFLLR